MRWVSPQQFDLRRQRRPINFGLSRAMTQNKTFGMSQNANVTVTARTVKSA
jgi:hypothetical protein